RPARRGGAAPGTPAGDRLEGLAILVEDYERAHHPIPPPTPPEAIRVRMEQLDCTQADLARLLGSKRHTSENPRGTRTVTLAMIRRLHAAWHIPAEALIAEPPTAKPKPKPKSPSPRGGRRTTRAA